MRVVYRGAVFADATDFDKCVALWMHALDIKQKNLKNTPVAKDVLRFAQVISNIMSFGLVVECSNWCLISNDFCFLFIFYVY